MIKKSEMSPVFRLSVNSSHGRSTISDGERLDKFCRGFFAFFFGGVEAEEEEEDQKDEEEGEGEGFILDVEVVGGRVGERKSAAVVAAAEDEEAD